MTTEQQWTVRNIGVELLTTAYLTIVYLISNFTSVTKKENCVPVHPASKFSFYLFLFPFPTRREQFVQQNEEVTCL
jgi:hypothetical protein